MKKITLLYFLLFGVSLFSQITFEGKVMDEQTKKPIKNVTVYFTNLNKTVLTNEDGFFEVVITQKNNQLIELYHLDYGSKVISIAPETLTNIELSEKILELEEIVVTGNLNANKEKIPFAIETIKKETLLSSGKVSLAENLSSIPGINFASNGIAATKPVIRGLTNSNLVFLNNGIKAENFQFSTSHPFISDEFSARKIEIIKGPFSLIYGSDAVGGIINVIAENPVAENTLLINYNSQYHSNTEGFVNNLNIKTSGKKWFGGIHATKKTHKDYEDGKSNPVINSRFRETNVGANLGYRNSFGNFTFSYDYALPEYGLTNQKSITFINNDNRIPRDWFQKLENHLFTLKNVFYIKNNTLDIDFGYQKNTRQGISDITNTNPEMLFAEMDLKTFSYNSKYTINTSKNKLIIGFNGANIENDANDFYKNSNPMPDAKINDIGVFIVNDYTLNDKLNIYSGIRFDNRFMESNPFQSNGLNKYTVDNEYNSFSGSLGSTYKINNHLVKLNISSGFRSPNISELSQNGIHQNRFERGDLNLEAQRNYQLDVNYHFHIKNLVFDFSPFYNSINNFIYVVQTLENAPIGGGKIWEYIQNDANLYGAEFSLDYHPLKWLGIHTNYTWTKGELKKGGYLTQIPQNRWVAELKLDKEKIAFLNKPNFTINYTNFQSQDNLGQLETYSPTYNLVNLSFGSAIALNKHQINWFISANNIFNEVYIDHLSGLKQLNENNIGRNVVFGLRYSLENNL